MTTTKKRFASANLFFYVIKGDYREKGKTSFHGKRSFSLLPNPHPFSRKAKYFLLPLVAKVSKQKHNQRQRRSRNAVNFAKSPVATKQSEERGGPGEHHPPGAASVAQFQSLFRQKRRKRAQNCDTLPPSKPQTRQHAHRNKPAGAGAGERCSLLGFDGSVFMCREAQASPIKPRQRSGAIPRPSGVRSGVSPPAKKSQKAKNGRKERKQAKKETGLFCNSPVCFYLIRSQPRRASRPSSCLVSSAGRRSPNLA